MQIMNIYFVEYGGYKNGTSLPNISTFALVYVNCQGYQFGLMPIFWVEYDKYGINRIITDYFAVWINTGLDDEICANY